MTAKEAMLCVFFVFCVIWLGYSIHKHLYLEGYTDGQQARVNYEHGK